VHDVELDGTRELHAKQAEELDSLTQKLFDLGGEVAGGRHVPPGVRVLSLRDNPAQQWTDTREIVLNQLREENDALLRRLAELERDRPSDVAVTMAVGAGMVPRESWELVNREKRDLEKELQQKEKRLLRLQQVFTSKSAEFRETVASVLGLKLAFYPNGQVRVTSIFDLCASFVFQPVGERDGSGGVKMQLIAQGEGGPQDLPQLMKYWIEEEGCIPGFLASVTLECWDKAKRG
jgi:mitotic spindle assembly checkpoint protein MAD1